MNISTKYSVGERLYLLEMSTIPYSQQCDCCDGERKVRIKDMLYSCPKCQGKGKTNTLFAKQWKVRTDEVTVAAVVTCTDSTGTETQYVMKELPYEKIDESNLFVSAEEALKACTNRNALKEEVPA